MGLSSIDKNFKVDAEINKEGFKFYSADEEPIRRYGVMRENGTYVRIPQKLADSLSEGISSLTCQTSGGRVRFTTDSTEIAIIARFSEAEVGPHMPFSNNASLDLYINNEYFSTFLAPVKLPNLAFESVKVVPEGMKNVEINFPPYGKLIELYIGVLEGSTILPHPDYKYETPVVYYGSSITQGGCASRGGLTYPAMLSRWLNCNYTNLGFSGNAKGEKLMVDYMADLDMSVFVCDYDHNAPTVEHLKATHEPLYRRMREKHPDMPIIFITKPTQEKTDFVIGCREIIRETYNKAVSEGDKNVYFIDGSSLFPFESNDYTVDGVHPTDLGFYFMAKGLYELLKSLLEKTE